MAVSLIDVVEFFIDTESVKIADVSVETERRITSLKQTPLPAAISSLMGIHMATSGCPKMDKLRPMVLNHLPFSTAEETTYRAVSMYLLAQYFRGQKGHEPDMKLEGLGKVYRDVNTLNRDFSARFRNLTDSDATINAIVGLDCFAQLIEFSITEEMLEDIEVQFEGYLEDGSL